MISRILSVVPNPALVVLVGIGLKSHGVPLSHGSDQLQLLAEQRHVTLCVQV